MKPESQRLLALFVATSAISGSLANTAYGDVTKIQPSSDNPNVQPGSSIDPSVAYHTNNHSNGHLDTHSNSDTNSEGEFDQGVNPEFGTPGFEDLLKGGALKDKILLDLKGDLGGKLINPVRDQIRLNKNF